ILDALDGLCGQSRNGTVELLRRYAPSWLVNLPQLTDPTERAELERQTVGITPERRLREIAAFLESLAAEHTVSLVLEDLHWLDPSTLALITFLARRREPARLMLIGTYREGEVERLNHPLKGVKEELELHHYCTHLPLKLLSRSAVGDYLNARFETPHVSDQVTTTVYKRSEGNPLFMVNVTDYLVAHRAIVQQGGSVELTQPIENESTPATLSQLIERQFEALPLEGQTLLEVASVRGMSFCSAAVAAGLGKPVEEVESQCEKLVEREQFLQPGGTGRWPDGTVFSRYNFIHALYQNVIYEQVTEARRARLHQTIGGRLEAAFQGQTEEMAAELALHFERAGNYRRAVHYLLQAAQKAMRQCGFQEAIQYETNGLELLRRLPQGAERSELELTFELLRGVCFASSKGYAAEESRAAFDRARALSHGVGNKVILFQTLTGLWSYYLLRGELKSALELGRQLLALSRQNRNPVFLLHGHMTVALSLFYLGDIQASHKHLEEAIKHYDLDCHKSTIPAYGWDPGIVVHCYDAQALWMLGYPDKAEEQARKALSLVQVLGSPFNTATANGLVATYYMYRRDAKSGYGFAQSGIEVATKGGFYHWLALATFSRGWALCKLDRSRKGIDQIQEGINQWRASGAEMAMPTFLAFKAEADLMLGNIKEASASIEEGLAISRKNDEHYYDAELYRLKGELLLHARKNLSRKKQLSEPEHSFRQGIQTARRQKAKSLELRATVGLGRWRSIGKRKEAYAMLAPLCAWFTEGLNIPDLIEALDLLKQLL
ncbi:MAG TPA: AAA family ATPase, partial [Candidatus Binatia bacterium]